MKEDLISRQAAIDAIYACYIGGEEAVDKARANNLYAEGIDEAVRAVEELPPAQPEIICCQDCRYGEGKAHNVRCTKWYGMGGYDDFCSRADRREE